MIRLDNVSTPHCLRGVTASFDDGETVVVCGPSGAGKSTLLRVMAGLEPLAGGQVWCGDQAASKAGQCLLPPHQREIGMVFQDQGLWPHLDVRKNIALGMRQMGSDAKSRAGKLEEMLVEFQLQGFGQRALGSLSGGELCRVALARALVSEPKHLLLDEPFTGLDVVLKEGFQSLLTAVQQRRSMTIIAVAHDSRDALAMRPTRLLLIDKGEIKRDIPIGELPRSLPDADCFLTRWLGNNDDRLPPSD